MMLMKAWHAHIGSEGCSSLRICLLCLARLLETCLFAKTWGVRCSGACRVLLFPLVDEQAGYAACDFPLEHIIPAPPNPCTMRSCGTSSMRLKITSAEALNLMEHCGHLPLQGLSWRLCLRGWTVLLEYCSSPLAVAYLACHVSGCAVSLMR